MNNNNNISTLRILKEKVYQIYTFLLSYFFNLITVIFETI